MLCISRKPSEWFTINVDGRLVRVLIRGVERGKVHIGIVADKDILVSRDELLQPPTPLKPIPLPPGADTRKDGA